VSWLFVAVIPGLLMLATIGLQRVESRLNQECVGAADVAEFLAAARPGDMRTLARDGMPEALDCFQRRRTRSVDQPVPAMANPQFRPTRHADSV
jgi:hypothetical protein